MYFILIPVCPMLSLAIHFHVLGDGCTGCFFRDSSVHESFYRCISVHATNALEVSENVAYDITGFCYYLEDGIEERNTFSFNLAAHIHFLSYPASGDSQRINVVEENANLLLPADIAASGFYITNMYNTLVGNTASGGKYCRWNLCTVILDSHFVLSCFTH
jgi:hypothetical protein